jgi:L-asparagine transporter-like permease
MTSGVFRVITDGAMGILAFTFFSYLISIRRSPDKDPRVTASIFPLWQQWLMMLVSFLVFVFLMPWLRAQGWTNVSLLLSLIIMLAYLAMTYYLNRHYGNLNANAASVKVGKIPLRPLMMVLFISLLIFLLLSGFLGWPRVYIESAFIIFMLILIGLIVLVRRSQKKSLPRE